MSVKAKQFQEMFGNGVGKSCDAVISRKLLD